MTQTQDSNPTPESNEPGKPKIVFAEGCFDNFEGTQEELDELLVEIQRLVDTGEFFEQARPISDEEVEEMIADGKNRTRQ